MKGLHFQFLVFLPTFLNPKLEARDVKIRPLGCETKDLVTNFTKMRTVAVAHEYLFGGGDL
jgi:hypothetical protein